MSTSSPRKYLQRDFSHVPGAFPISTSAWVPGNKTTSRHEYNLTGPEAPCRLRDSFLPFSHHVIPSPVIAGRQLGGRHPTWGFSLDSSAVSSAGEHARFLTSPLHSYADTGLGPLEGEERRERKGRRGEREGGGEERRERRGRRGEKGEREGEGEARREGRGRKIMGMGRRKAWRERIREGRGKWKGGELGLCSRGVWRFCAEGMGNVLYTL